MSVDELLKKAQAEGILLMLTDGRLTWEAGHEPPSELLKEMHARRLEIIAVLSEAYQSATRAKDWLARVARLLECSPEYLLERRFLLPDELAGLCLAPPRIAGSVCTALPLYAAQRGHFNGPLYAWSCPRKDYRRQEGWLQSCFKRSKIEGRFTCPDTPTLLAIVHLGTIAGPCPRFDDDPKPGGVRVRGSLAR